MASQTSDFIDAATKLGYTQTSSRGSHMCFTHPEVRHKIFTALTPSDPRSYKNSLALMKRSLRKAKAEREQECASE